MASQQFTIKLAMDSAGVAVGVAQASRQVDAFGKRLVGMFAVGSVAGLFQKIIAEGSKVSDVAKKWGASTDFVQEIGFAAKQSGVDIGSLESSFRSAQRAQVAALEGNKEQIAAFDRLGISVAKLRTLRPEELFKEIAKGFGNIPASARATADAVALLGKNNDQMLSAFRDGFIDVAHSAKDAGQVIEKDVVNSLDSAGDRIEAFGRKWMVALAPGVSKLVELADYLGDFVNQSLGFAASVAGGLSGGASFGDSMQMAADRMNEQAKESAELQSKKAKDAKQSIDASDIQAKDDKEKKEKKAAKEKAESILGNSDADALAKRGVFIGGRGGEIARIPTQQLSELRAMRNRMDKLVELQREARQGGNPLIVELRKLNAKWEDA